MGESRFLEKLYDEFKGYSSRDVVGPGSLGISLSLAVSQDTEGRKAVAPFLKKNGYHFPVLLDPTNEIGEEYNVSAVPQTFIIDPQARIVARHVEPFDWAQPDFKEALRELLKGGEKLSRCQPSGDPKQTR